MGTEPRQPDGPFGALPFHEDELLAYVEGELPAARQGELTAFLESRPELRRTLNGMRKDRLILSEVGDAVAPDGLLDEALAVIEREALFGGEGGVADPAPIPIVKARSPRRLQAFAMAAGFLLVAGGASYWISVLVKPVAAPPAGPPSLVIAESTPGITDRKAASAAPEQPGAGNPEADLPAIAGASNAEPGDEIKVADATISEGAPSSGRAGPSGIGSRSYPVATILPERAVELALEGRLAIRLSPQAGRWGYPDARTEDAAADLVGPRQPTLESDRPPTDPLVIEIPATVGAMTELYSTLLEDFAGEVSFEELLEAYDFGPRGVEDPISRFFEDEPAAPRITVPVLIDERP